MASGGSSAVFGRDRHRLIAAFALNVFEFEPAAQSGKSGAVGGRLAHIKHGSDPLQGMGH